MEYKDSKKEFEKALSLIKKGDVAEAFDLYCDSLLERIEGDAFNLEFYFFYRSQLIKYLKAKRSLLLSLEEADMISDLIYSGYQEFLEDVKDNRFLKSAKGRLRLLLSFEITFPIQNDTGLDDFLTLVSK